MRNYIALAIPFFFLLIGAEWLWARARRVRTYRFNDAIVDLSSGTAQQVAAVFLAGWLLAAYAAIWDRYRLLTLPASSAWTWLLTFLLVDFKYYWWHRLSHQVNFLWAAHVVHHSSEDYNLAVALRQSITTLVTALPFALPLALLGVPPLVFLTLESFSTLYQFWIHTELVGKLGWFERVFNTPSQHRVHHAVNPHYLDRNYGATLCVWDRLFGSFIEEVEQPVYGLVKPLRSFNPVWAQVHRYLELWQLSRAAPAWGDKLRVWLEGPQWSVPGLPPLPPPPRVTPESRPKYDPPIAGGLRAYLWLQLSLAMSGAFFLLLLQNQLPRPVVEAGGLLTALTLLAWGGLIEQRRWAVPLEILRLLVAGTALIGFAGGHLPPAALVAALLLLAAPALALLGTWRTRQPAA